MQRREGNVLHHTETIATSVAVTSKLRMRPKMLLRFSLRQRFLLKILSLPRWQFGRFWRECGAGANPLDYVPVTNTFQEELMRRMALHYDNGAEEKQILGELVGNVGKWGFLEETPSNIAATLGCSPEVVEILRKNLQQFEGRGIGSLHFRDFLRFQLENQKNEDFGRVLRVLNWQCAHNQIVPLLRLLHGRLPRESFDHIMNLFARRRLLPHPSLDGLHWETELAAAEPDLQIECVDGKWIVQAFPSADEIPPAFLGADGGASLKHARDGLRWRHDLLVKIGQALLDRQKKFFERGPQFLKILLQKDLAAGLTVSPSTITRAVGEKFVRTPHGTYPCEQLFCRSLGKSPILLEFGLRHISRNNPESFLWSNQRRAEELQKFLGIPIASAKSAKSEIR
ncbi:MAG: hypothetical protein LBC42_02035 [Puniceicoccales bacterium]|nr:hypothetical protein [Puniceicoccales bacterium]